jgi:hypothetical protein
MAGYSTTPLEKKLGIKPGFTIFIHHAPSAFLKSILLPENVIVLNKLSGECDLIHLFSEKSADTFAFILRSRKHLKSNGMIWVSWPKKSSGVKTDLTEDVIRKFALENGLVDFKVCAVDDVWSGLKLVIPLKDRLPEKK